MIARAIRIHRGTFTPKRVKGADAVDIGTDTATGIVKYFGGGTTRQLIDNWNAQTVAGAKTFSGTAAFTGATTGVRKELSVTSAATATLTAAQSGLTVIATRTSLTQVFTLPLAATAGLAYTFVCAHADGEIHVGVGTGDNIIGKTHGAENGTGLVSTVSSGLLKNTAASNVVGDFTTLVSDGITTWYMTSVAGVWSVT